jgi:CBS domain-containing protein
MSQSAKVREFMAASLVTFSPETEIMDAIDALVSNRISGAPVVDAHGNLVGVLSEQDCMKVALHAGYFGEPGGRVSEYMSTDVRTVDADTSIVELARTFLDAPYRRYPVLDNARLVGQISRRDVLRALQQLR